MLPEVINFAKSSKLWYNQPYMKKNSSTVSVPTKRIRNWPGIVYTLFSGIIIIIGTYFAIRWAQGDFRFDQSADLLAKETGLLHATSFPQGAQVYIDGKLTSVTDNTIYLAPGEYEVVIQKDGYSPWKKNIRIEKALVSQTNATLFPYSPSLTSLTFTGVDNPLPSPDGSKILFFTSSASAKNKNGLYVLDLGNSQKSPRQISDNDPDFSLENAKFVWSPDSNDILVVTKERTFLLNSNNFSNLQSSPDVTLQLKSILGSWEEDLALREKQFTEKIPPLALNVILENSKNIFLSPDNTKIFYTATGSAQIAENLIPALPAPNSQPEQRSLQPNHMYVYDSYEDKNYFLGNSPLNNEYSKYLLTTPTVISGLTFATNQKQPILNSLQVAGDLNATLDNFAQYYGNHLTRFWQWLPDSTHLVGVVDNQIVITNYDGNNPTAIYSGPFADNFVLPYPDNNKILISTKFNPDSPENIYAIELKK